MEKYNNIFNGKIIFNNDYINKYYIKFKFLFYLIKIFN